MMKKNLIVKLLITCVLLTGLTGIYALGEVRSSTPTENSGLPGSLPAERFVVYSNGDASFANGKWNFTDSGKGSTTEYKISSERVCQKIILKPNGEKEDPSAYFGLLGADLKKDVTSYNRIRFDVWFEEELDNDLIYFALCSPESEAGYRILRKAIPSITNEKTHKWITIDISVDELFTHWNSFDKNYILKELEQIRFTTPYTNDFNKTFYVDNICFYHKEIDLTTPGTPAHLPPVIKSDDVISVFSDSYANLTTQPSLSPSSESIEIDDNNIWKFKNTDKVELSFDPSHLNISGMTHAHLDLWTQVAGDVTISLNGNSKLTISTLGSEWLRLDIPLSGLTNISSIAIEGTEKTYYVDNLYFYKDQPQFKVDISAFNKSLGRGINFGDIFDYEGKNWNPAYMKMVADLGFSHVRLPVHWESYGRSMAEAPYNITSEFLNKIKDVVDLAIDYNLKIIINMHHHNAFSADPSGQEERFISQWTQIADFFRYYPDNLAFEVFNEPSDNNIIYFITPDIWNDVLEKGLKAIRTTNPKRPVLIGVAGGGGISRLPDLKLPEDDPNLIVTIHYYNPSEFTHQGATWSNPIPPVGTEWHDTEYDRMKVEKDFKMIEDYIARDNRPIHIGEFGVYEKADMDSRVRWTTYIARYIEQKGYSWAYWDFDAKFGIYDPKKEVYRQPLVDALLKKNMPEEPMQEKWNTLEVLYDSNNGTAEFGMYGDGNLTRDDRGIIISIINGGDKVHSVATSMLLGLEKGVSYRVSFTVSSNIDYDATFMNYFQKKSVYDRYSPELKYVTTQVPTTYSYTFTMKEEDDPVAQFVFDLGGGGNNPVTVTLHDIKIEEIEFLFEAAPQPTPAENTIKNIYSTTYPGSNNITFSDAGNATFIKDNNGKDLISFSNFDEQIITLPENISLEEKMILHLDAYAGSPLRLAVTLLDNINKTDTFELPSHKWTSLDMDIDLSNALKSSKYIKQIKLSNGTGDGRKLYMDNIYLYQKQGSDDNPDPKEKRNVWQGVKDGSWNDRNNWSLKSVPDDNTIVYLLGNREIYPVLKDTETNICKEIYFLPGAQLGRSDLLTYEKVHVQMNLGLKGSEQRKSMDINEPLLYAAEYSAPSLARNRWHMLSIPLGSVFSGDFSFGGYPGTDMAKIEINNSTSGHVLNADWSTFATMTEKLEPAKGFIYRMNGYRNEWPYLESGRDNSYSEFGLKLVNGILELPYYENSIMSSAHRIHKYNENTRTSTFYLLSSSGDITNNKQTADRGNTGYRFIFEENASLSPNVTYRVENNVQGNMVLVGNPYMSAIDFDKFYEDNKDVIKPLYQLWTGNTFAAYDILTGKVSGEVDDNQIDQLIAPMQSFLVELKEDIDVDEANLIFNIKNITPARLTTNSALKSESMKTMNDAITITATNSVGEVETFIAQHTDGSSVFSEMEGKKLIASIETMPDIYLLKSIEEGTNRQTGIPFAIIGSDRVEMPLAVACSLKDKMKFTFAGMDRNDATITFIDIEKGISRDITGMSIFEYEFDHTPLVSANHTVVAEEDRFRIRFVPKAVGTESLKDIGSILISKNESSINVMTTGNDLIQQVNLYDIQGRVLFKAAAINDMYYTIPRQNAAYPLIILEVVTNNDVKRFKIM